MKAVIFANHKDEENKFAGKEKAFLEVFGKTLLEYNSQRISPFVNEIIVVTLEEKGDMEGVTFVDQEDFYGNMFDLLTETTIFIDGGTYYEYDFEKFIEFHKNHRRKITVALSEKNNFPLSTKVILNSDWVFNGLCILEKELIGINVLRYLKSGNKNDISFYHSKEKVIPVESVWDVMNISFGFINKIKSEVHKSTFIDESAKISPLCYIGKNCRIGKFAEIGAYCVIEDDCIIKDGARLKYSTLCRNSYVGKNSEIVFSYVMENSAIGDRCVLRGGNVVESDFVICNDSVVEENKAVREGVENGEKTLENNRKILK